MTRLQADGRIANVDLAEAVSLSPSACLRRVRALESSGLISAYRAEVDRVRAGLGLTAVAGRGPVPAVRTNRARTRGAVPWSPRGVPSARIGRLGPSGWRPR